jgi:hypothetical protein
MAEPEARLPAHIEVSALIRRTQAAGGFATVLKKGEPEAGTLMLVLTHNDTDTRAYERMPQADGSRQWAVSRVQDVEKAGEFTEYLERRGKQDGDLWIVELDIANGEQLIGLKPYRT